MSRHLISLSNLKKVINSCRLLGFKTTKKRIGIRLRVLSKYNKWYQSNRVSAEKLQAQRQVKFAYEPLISFITPTFNTPEPFLRAMVESVLAQSYAHWEICLADGSTDGGAVYKILQAYAAQDTRIKIKRIGANLGISGNSNEALAMAKGDYIALLDHDDLLTPDALYEMVKVINETQADFIYSDEDKTDKSSKNFFEPAFKPCFAPDYFLANNYLCHLTIIKGELLEKAGRYFNSEYDGAQDYDLFLRCSEHAKKILHIPKILYHWRIHPGSAASGNAAKPYTHEAGKKAVQAHLNRLHISALAQDGPFDLANTYRVNYDLVDKPLVSIVIPTCDHKNDLQKCLQSIINKSTYTNYEILVVENNSTEKEVFSYYRQIEGKYKIRVLYYPNKFNYSAINNWAVKQTKGKYLVLLNNDVEIITPNWLESLLMFAQRQDVGAVGAKLFYLDHTIQHGGVIIGAYSLPYNAFGGLRGNEPGYMARAVLVQNLSAVTAALMMLSKKVFLQLQGFDERLAVAYNDVDLCLSIRKAGYLIVYDPDVQAYHYESKSRGYDDTLAKRKRAEQEIMLLRKKWGGDLHDPYYNINLEKICSQPFRM